MAYDPRYAGYILTTTGTPAATSGQNGDYALDTTTAGGPYIYYKSGGAWGAAVGLKGAAGAAGNLYNIVTKTANYTVVPADLTGNTLVVLANAASSNVAITIDAANLYNGTPTPATSLVVIVKRIDNSTTYGVTIVAGGTSETIEGTTSVAVLSLASRRIFAANANTLYIE